LGRKSVARKSVPAGNRCPEIGEIGARDLKSRLALTGVLRIAQTCYPSSYRRRHMAFLNRIGVAMDSELLTRFESFAKKGYTNRSDAFPELIRDRLVAKTVVCSTPNGPFSKSA